MTQFVMCDSKRWLQMFMFQTNLEVGLFVSYLIVLVKVKALLNHEIKAQKEFILKTFGEKMSYKTYDVVQLAVASKNSWPGN